MGAIQFPWFHLQKLSTLSCHRMKVILCWPLNLLLSLTRRRWLCWCYIWTSIPCYPISLFSWLFVALLLSDAMLLRSPGAPITCYTATQPHSQYMPLIGLPAFLQALLILPTPLSPLLLCSRLWYGTAGLELRLCWLYASDYTKQINPSKPLRF